MPTVIADARTSLGSDLCRARCAAVPGSFLEFVPAGADAYLLSGVIHDWDDDRAITILQNCRRSMRKSGRTS